MKKIILLVLSSMLILPVAYADTIELSNGKTMEGTFIGREGDTIKFEVDGVNMSFQANDVKNISMGSSAGNSADTRSEARDSTAAAGSSTIAAGTNLTVRLSDTLDSGRHASGHKFAAVLEGALVADGVTVAPAGSKAYGVVSEAQKSRRLAGESKMLITLTGININGEIVPVSTSSINAYTVPTGATSAGQVTRGAAIGALADGSSGAKTGAKVGLGAALLSGGNQVVIPPGTMLEFKLDQALSSQ